MSKVNVKEFFEELEKNPALKEKYLGVVKDEKNPMVKVIPFAKEQGFTFEESDLNEYCSEISDNLNMNSALADEELMKASGGRSQSDMIRDSIISMGISCAIISAHAAVKGKNCGAALSITPDKVCETK